MDIENQTQEKSNGALIGFVIILIILVAASVYFLVKRHNSPEQLQQQAVEQLKTQGTSDDISSIESDLQNTDLSNIDSSLSDIEGSLQ